MLATVNKRTQRASKPLERSWTLRHVGEDEFFAALAGPLDGAEKRTERYQFTTLTQFFASGSDEPLAQVVQFHHPEDKQPRTQYYLA